MSENKEKPSHFHTKNKNHQKHKRGASKHFVATGQAPPKKSGGGGKHFHKETEEELDEKYQNRTIESNVEKYQDKEVEISYEEKKKRDLEELKAKIQKDVSGSYSYHLNAIEKEWSTETDLLSEDKENIFSIDLKQLAEELNTLPLHEKLGFDEKYMDKNFLKKEVKVEEKKEEKKTVKKEIPNFVAPVTHSSLDKDMSILNNLLGMTNLEEPKQEKKEEKEEKKMVQKEESLDEWLNGLL